MVSIIVPVYNCYGTLPRCAKSILDQTYKNIELILVDDGSTDSSSKLCDEIAKSDNRVKVIHKKNGGVSSARNVGIKQATGKYLQFVDSDDFIDEKATEVLVALVETYKTQMAIFGFYYVTKENRVSEYLERNNKISVQEFINRTPDFASRYIPNAVWNKLFFRELVDFEFDESMSLGEDLIFVYDYLKKIQEVSVSDKCLLNYMVENPGSLSGKVSPKKIIDTAKVYRKSLDFYTQFESSLNLRQITEICASTIMYSTVDVIRSNKYTRVEKKKFIKQYLDNKDVRECLKACTGLSYKQKILSYLICHKMNMALQILIKMIS